MSFMLSVSNKPFMLNVIMPNVIVLIVVDNVGGDREASKKGKESLEDRLGIES